MRVVCMYPECRALIAEVPDCEDPRLQGEEQTSHGCCESCLAKHFPAEEAA